MQKRLIKSAILLSLVSLYWASVSAQQTIPDSLDGVVYRGEFDNVARGVINGKKKKK